MPDLVRGNTQRAGALAGSADVGAVLRRAHPLDADAEDLNATYGDVLLRLQALQADGDHDGARQAWQQGIAAAQAKGMPRDTANGFDRSAPVSELVLERLSLTVPLAVMAMALTTVLAARRRTEVGASQ